MLFGHKPQRYHVFGTFCKGDLRRYLGRASEGDRAITLVSRNPRL
ncbi:hypothetical protein [Microcoleus sp.]